MKFVLTNAQQNTKTEFELRENFRLQIAAYGSSTATEITEIIELANPNWKIILDEAFRTIDTEGNLDFRVREYSAGDLRNLWLFLGAPSPEHECTLIRFEELDIFYYAITIKVKNLIPIDRSWSVCYITDGRSLDQINGTARILNSKSNYEVIVIGPEHILPHLLSTIIFISFLEAPRSNMISLKKNLLISASKGSNLIFLHDRYLLSENFTEEFENFGYHFGAVAPRQLFIESQNEYPSLLTFSNGRIEKIIDDTVTEQMWINGGCIVIKRKIAVEIQLNPMLTWNEGEDIDWYERLLAAGVVARRASNCILYTVGTSPELTNQIKTFKPVFNTANLISDLRCQAEKGDSTFFNTYLKVLENYGVLLRQNKGYLLLDKSIRINVAQHRFVTITADRFLLFLFCGLISRLGTLKNSVRRLEVLREIRDLLKKMQRQTGYKTIFVIAILFFQISINLCLAKFNQKHQK